MAREAHVIDEEDMAETEEVFAPRTAQRLRGAGPVLGTMGNKPFRVDLAKLMATRLFITAASGGGKSYALRRILERTQSMVQQIVLDPEGELVTLAEKYPFVVCSPDSETFPIRVETAADLASKIYRSGQSAIISLNNFDIEEMQEFVAEFLAGLMKEPKEHWHYCIVAIDEAQIFAPQQDKSVSKKPMLDLAARARKRGICPVVATQRMSQMHKGVVAHLDNLMIGLTTLDKDVDRAAEALGMKESKAGAILRRLKAGEFMVYGPALTYEVEPIKVGPVVTRHGALGAYEMTKPKPRLTRRELMKEVKAMVPPVAEVAKQSKPVPLTLPVEEVIANMRHWVIAPLLGERQWGAVSARARVLQLPQVEVNKWLNTFQQHKTLESLRPKRVRDGMLCDARRLAPGWSPTYQRFAISGPATE